MLSDVLRWADHRRRQGRGRLRRGDRQEKRGRHESHHRQAPRAALALKGGTMRAVILKSPPGGPAPRTCSFAESPGRQGRGPGEAAGAGRVCRLQLRRYDDAARRLSAPEGLSARRRPGESPARWRPSATGVTEVAVGDRVAGFSRMPVASPNSAPVPAERLVRIPDAIGLDRGGGLLPPGADGLAPAAHRQAPTRQGRCRCSIHAIGGGVGLYLTQLARQSRRHA